MKLLSPEHVAAMAWESDHNVTWVAPDVLAEALLASYGATVIKAFRNTRSHLFEVVHPQALGGQEWRTYGEAAGEALIAVVDALEREEGR